MINFWVEYIYNSSFCISMIFFNINEVINNILDVSLLPPINVSTSESSLSGISDNNDSVGPLKL